MPIKPPEFERAAVVIGDNARLLAEISSMFRRNGRYLAVSDGPRLSRPDAENEIIRRSNLIAAIEPRRIVLSGLPPDTCEKQAQGYPKDLVVSVSSNDEAAAMLKGLVRPRASKLSWGETNLGIGLMLARQAGSTLTVTRTARTSDVTFAAGGTHILIACEAGNELGQVIASNLAFSIDASFLVFPELSEENRKEWLEELYLIGSQEQVVSFEVMKERATAWLPDEVKSGRYNEVLFITNGFPWGIGIPDVPTSHLYGYPDFGCAVVHGIWACADPTRSARTALLVQPGKVEGSEIEVIAAALSRNKTLVRVLDEAKASVHTMEMIIQSVPFDLIVFATHAGDWKGERVTYEFFDNDGRMRRLVVDEAMGFGYDPATDQVMVQWHEHFHELDGVAWTDKEGKANLPVGSAIVTWAAFSIEERREKRIAQVAIDRVRGSMALQMHDHVWLPAIQGLPSETAPVVLNNACSSWHELSGRFMFGGARVYIGTLFPISNLEAQDVASALFGELLGKPLSKALWVAQNKVYGDQPRRPYVMVGLPFCNILPNRVNSILYMRERLKQGIVEFGHKAQHSPHDDVRRNSARLKEFLIEELRVLALQFGARRGN